ncbi:MAG: hypothetical protein K9N09_09400 [Candidatus Cloacimonetes bacterium]|nr:hypothetical protein [Candidatus Cloacimonadota bacterium]MCF7813885.1 hypothetical protein [Candidatus Cloacimonadota bacterium]MCF7868904.1 hypothetical protein [Candidatus Cloacimonadota bacterium]MCF7883997.1 hypothetical protein [Candidatus Cloacimonadota bacterium]
MKSNNRNYRYRNRRNKTFSGRNSVVSTLITAFASIVTKDLLSDNSKIKRFLKNTFQPQKIEKQKKKEIIDGKYSVLDEISETEEQKIKHIGEKK